MRTAQEIYEVYRIMPSLQLHQLRVAAVGKMVCEHFSVSIDERSVVLACLLHDMGNIIKSDLEVFPDFVEPEGYDYWKKVKDEWHAKYGDDEHHATIEVVNEIGLPERVAALIDGIGFSELETVRDSISYEQKIVEYGDSRVGPRGILTLAERQAEARERYLRKKGNTEISENPQEYERLRAAVSEIERQVFEHCSIKPEEINDVSAAALVEELRHYPVA